MWHHMIWVFVLVTSLSMIISRSIYVAANGIISFFMLSNIPLYIYMYHIFFIQFSVDGHFSCFHVLTIINNATMNTGVHLSYRIRVFVFFRYVSRSGIAGWVEYLNRNMNIGKNRGEGISESLGILFEDHILPALFHFVKCWRFVYRINCLRVA